MSAKQIESMKKNRSAALILRVSVESIIPKAKAMGYEIENNHVIYSFAVQNPISPKEIDQIAQSIAYYINSDLPFEQFFVLKEEAGLLFKDDPFMLEQVEKHHQNVLKVCLFDNFLEIAENPFLEHSGEIDEVEISQIQISGQDSQLKKPIFQRIHAHVA